MAVALTSLTFSVEDGRDYNGTYRQLGQVQVVDLSCYHLGFNSTGCPEQVTMQSRAHAYGQMSLAAEVGNYTDTSDIYRSKNNYWLYQRTTKGIQDHQQYAFRFNEYNMMDKQQLYPSFTNRTFTVESFDCSRYKEVHVDNTEPLSYSSDDGKINGNIAVPVEFLGRKGTTYIYRGHNAPESAPKFSCGDRCLKMWAYQNPQSGPGFFYECSVSISAVSNVYDSTHEIPNNMTKIAAAAIALQGQYKGSATDTPNFEAFTFHAVG